MKSLTTLEQHSQPLSPFINEVIDHAKTHPDKYAVCNIAVVSTQDKTERIMHMTTLLTSTVQICTMLLSFSIPADRDEPEISALLIPQGESLYIYPPISEEDTRAWTENEAISFIRTATPSLPVSTKHTLMRWLAKHDL